MKVIITGATGFIGRNLAERCLMEGYDVACCGRSADKLKTMPSNIKTMRFDITDREGAEKAFKKEGADLVFHCAANTVNRSINCLRKVNVEGTRNVLEASLAAKIKKIVYLSSISVISGNRMSLMTDTLPYASLTKYGASKIEAEKLALSYRNAGLQIAILRPAMVYGEDDCHWLPFLIFLLKLRLLPIVGAGENRYPLVYIQNLLDVMIKCVSEENAYSGTFLVADNEQIQINELFNYIAKIINSKPPMRIFYNVNPVFSSIPILGKCFSIFREDRVCCLKSLKERINYLPGVTFYEGMEKTLLSQMRRKNSASCLFRQAVNLFM